MANKKSKLQTAAYILLSGSFREWLELLGYSPLSIPVLTLAVTDFLHHQEQQGKISLQQMDVIDADAFIQTTQEQRPCSNGHVNKRVQALKLFSRYLRETGRMNTSFDLQRLPEQRSKPTWLTKAEIQALYEAAGDSVLGIRDRAMLAVFYGCGLRLHEGASLELRDINKASKLLHVRKGKHYKERLVPVAERNYAAILFYMDYGRPQLLQEHKTEALFIDANKGRPVQKQSLYVRIKGLAKKQSCESKSVGTRCGTPLLRTCCNRA
jgi:integrase/recombinase XerD